MARFVAVLLIAVFLMGCGVAVSPSASPGGAATPIATATQPASMPSPTLPSPTPSPAPSSASPSASPSGAPRDLAFSSPVYPYTIVLPPEHFEPGPVAVVPPPGTWKPARQPWDGSSEMSPSVPAPNDSTSDTDGDTLFVVGHPTGDNLDAFAARIIEHHAQWHGCSRTPLSRAIEVDGTAALLIGTQCGVGGGSAVAARLLLVHEGYGLTFNLLAHRSVEAGHQMDRLAAYVSGVDLRP